MVRARPVRPRARRHLRRSPVRFKPQPAAGRDALRPGPGSPAAMALMHHPHPAGFFARRTASEAACRLTRRTRRGTPPAAAGSSSRRASGAPCPWTRAQVALRRTWRWFCSSEAAGLFGSHSTAHTLAPGGSQQGRPPPPTEPVPAPTSHRVSSGSKASLERETARTSLLVMGALPRKNASSGMPRHTGPPDAFGRRLDQGHRQSVPLRLGRLPGRQGGQALFRVGQALPHRRPESWPRPFSASWRHRACTVHCPPVRKNTGLQRRTRPAGSSRSHSTPWALTRVKSCQGTPSRAARYWARRCRAPL